MNQVRGSKDKTSRPSYEVEVMISRAIAELSRKRTQKIIERRELYERVNEMYSYKHHGQILPQSYFSACLKSLKELDLIQPIFDISDEDARVKGFRPTRLFYVIFGGEEIFTKGLKYSHIVLDEVEPKPKSLLVDLDYNVKLNLNMDNILRKESFSEIEEIIKNWRQFKRQKCVSREYGKVNIAFNDFLTLHTLGPLVKEKEEIMENVGVKGGSKQILESIIKSEIDLAPNIPLSTLIDYVSNNDKLDNIACTLTPITLCNYVILDKEATKLLKTNPRKIDVFYKPGGSARATVGKLLSGSDEKCYESDDAAEAFLDNTGSNICLVTEAPWLASIIYNAKREDVRVFYYLEPLYLVVNMDTCRKNIVAKIEDRLKDSRVANIFNVHKTITENIDIVNNIVNKYIDIINSEIMDSI